MICIRFILLLILLAPSIAACSDSELTSRFQEEDDAARHYFDLIETRQFEPIRAAMDAKFVDDSLNSTLEKMASLFPPEQPKTIKLLGVHVLNGTNYDLRYEYQYSRKWLSPSIRLKKFGDKLVIEGIGVDPLADSLENINGLHFGEKSPAHYLLLLVGAGVLGFILWTIAVCIRTPIGRRKWLWLVFILVGMPSIDFNWTTGQLFVSGIQATLFGLGFSQQSYSPWILQVGFPLGAILFWRKRRHWMAERNVEEMDSAF